MIRFRTEKLRGVAEGLVLAVRLILGAILVLSAVAKLRQPFDFLDGVYSYQFAGPAQGLAVAVVLPWLELVVGFCLLAGLGGAGVLLATGVLCASFVIAQWHALHNGLKVDCGCFGSSAASPSPVSDRTLVRAGAMLAGAVLAYLCLLVAHASRKASGSGA